MLRCLVARTAPLLAARAAAGTSASARARKTVTKAVGRAATVKTPAASKSMPAKGGKRANKSVAAAKKPKKAPAKPKPAKTPAKRPPVQKQTAKTKTKPKQPRAVKAAEPDTTEAATDRAVARKFVAGTASLVLARMNAAATTAAAANDASHAAEQHLVSDEGLTGAPVQSATGSAATAEDTSAVVATEPQQAAERVTEGAVTASAEAAEDDECIVAVLASSAQGQHLKWRPLSQNPRFAALMRDADADGGVLAGDENDQDELAALEDGFSHDREEAAGLPCEAGLQCLSTIAVDSAPHEQSVVKSSFAFASPQENPHAFDGLTGMAAVIARAKAASAAAATDAAADETAAPATSEPKAVEEADVSPAANDVETSLPATDEMVTADAADDISAMAEPLFEEAELPVDEHDALTDEEPLAVVETTMQSEEAAALSLEQGVADAAHTNAVEYANMVSLTLDDVAAVALESPLERPKFDPAAFVAPATAAPKDAAPVAAPMPAATPTPEEHAFGETAQATAADVAEPQPAAEEAPSLFRQPEGLLF